MSTSWADGSWRTMSTLRLPETTSSSKGIRHHDRPADRRAVHGTLLPPRHCLHRRVLLTRPPGKGTLFAARVAAPKGGPPFRSDPCEARRDAMPWRLRGRADRGGVSGRRMVRESDARAARENCRRAPARWESPGGCRLLSDEGVTPKRSGTEQAGSASFTA